MEIIDSEFLRQFQAKVNNEVAFVEYSIQERKIFFTKVYFPDSVDEHFSDEFFKSVLEKIASQRLKVVPTCASAIAFFRRNKEYKELLPAGIRI
ncbi:MAG: N-acetyltransferase [Capnocytophaga sp.]|nr:N-acetyltransferase [Capnocytophaga sp.]